MQDRGSLGDRFVSALSIKRTTSPPVSATPSPSSVVASSITTTPASSKRQSDITTAIGDNKDSSQVGC